MNESLSPDGDRLERLYEHALTLPPDERRAFVDRECEDDALLREELLSLLEDGAGGETFLEDVGRLVEPEGGSLAARLSEALRGRYRIDGRIGVGGMAEVYRAMDLRHERLVALKVLRPALAAILGSRRFLAEIKTTANLQHPHILPLYDSGEADGLLFYVMPYVEGESLRQRLDRESQLPVDEAVRIVSGVAEALDFAHRRGVVHRDIKPGNVLLVDGRPVVSDFGIALALGAAGGERLTQTGLTLGSPHYMSPEQAMGEAHVGPSTDIWALGCLLHEMLIGEPPFTGSTPQVVLGKIVACEPPSATLIRPTVPSNVDAAIHKALQRVPADRFGRGAEFIEALRDRGFRERNDEHTGGALEDRSAGRVIRGLVASTVLLTALSGWLILHRSGPSQPPGPERFEFDAPGALGGISGGVSLGERGAVFVGEAPGGRRQLWLRRWDALSPVPIAGTEGASVATPSLSPEGSEVAFVADGQLKVVPVSGGAVRTLAVPADCCPRWNDDGFIYFTGVGTGIRRLRPDGRAGPAESVTELADGELAHLDMQVLPGGKSALFTVQTGVMGADFRIDAFHFETGDRTVVVETSAVRPRVTSTGHLLYGDRRRRILAAPFDADRMEVTGPSILAASGAVDVPGLPVTVFDLSPSGRLVYLTAAGGWQSPYEFVWLDRVGAATPMDSDLVLRPEGVGWALAPDGSRLAFNNLVDDNNDVYVKALPNGPVERVTTDPGVDQRPFWTPDGRRLLYFNHRGENQGDSVDLWSIGPNGFGAERILHTPAFAEGASSPATEWVALRTTSLPTLGKLPGVWAFRPGAGDVPVPLVDDEAFVENFPAVSPDGRWLAYTSDRTGSDEVYVRRFPGLGEGPGVRVSGDGGTSPRWAASGLELLFLRPDMVVMSSRFDPATRRASDSRELFALPDGGTGWAPRFEVAPDGRLLMIRPRAEAGASPSPRFVVVQHFGSELKRRDPL